MQQPRIYVAYGIMGRWNDVTQRVALLTHIPWMHVRREFKPNHRLQLFPLARIIIITYFTIDNY